MRKLSCRQFYIDNSCSERVHEGFKGNAYGEITTGKAQPEFTDLENIYPDPVS